MRSIVTIDFSSDLSTFVYTPLALRLGLTSACAVSSESACRSSMVRSDVESNLAKVAELADAPDLG